MKALGRQHIGPPREKPCLWGLQPGATCNNFLSYKDYLKNKILLVPNLLRYYTFHRDAQVRRLVYAFVVRMQQSQVFSHRDTYKMEHIHRIIILSSIPIKRKNKINSKFYTIV